ncbi:oligosaccharide 4-alpha-D-glucosyltransferase [Abditibacteriota bacterium]|nr:oligosaccharide 4-alpha-D-glucosyltransferase [Abditibacteriota bacterium]
MKGGRDFGRTIWAIRVGWAVILSENLMPVNLRSGIVALALTTTAGTSVVAQPQSQTSVVQKPGQVTVGAARFTVVSPLCVRLEYAPNNGFIDAPTLFAINRGARDTAAKIRRTGNGVSIETIRLRLSYQPDGKPFNATNLKVTFRGGKKLGSWQPGQSNPGNLGGPISTLDFQNRAVNLPPSLISREGWGLIDDSGRPLLVNDWIAPRPGGAPPTVESDFAKNQDLDWYLFAYGDNYQSALQALGTISGRAAMPRKANLGSWNSRWAKLSADDYRQIVREYEEHDFPLDIVVMDMEWHTQNATSGFNYADNLGWTGYTWNRQLIPDPQGLLQEFKQKGIYVTLNDHPHNGVRDHEEMYPEFMKRLGQTPAKGNNPLFNAGDRHYWDAFYATSHAALERQGVDFWWLDWQQDGLIPWVPGVPGLRHLAWLNELYFRESQKGGLRGQGYSRWGGWGDQRHPLQFSGDTTSNWEMLAFEVPFTTTSGNGGCFFWAHDTGGFFGSRNAEQYTRWTQFSGLSAALRVHSAGEDRRPWLWGKQSEDAMRVIYRLRSEMFPYIYTSVRECYDDMAPLLRPMYFNYPEQEVAYHVPGQYLFGDNVLVAPIVSPGIGPQFVAKQTVWFPQGNWYNIFTGEQFRGNAQALVTADINEVPLYARGGVPIPMQPYTPRMGSTPISQLRVRCYPGDSGKVGTATLYEDDGRSSEYQHGGFAKTPLSYVRRGNSVSVTIGATVGRFTGQLQSRSVVIELPGTSKATRATFQNGKATLSLPIEYDAATQLNRIVLPAQSVDQSTSVTVACSSADGSVLRERAVRRRVEGITGQAPALGATRQILTGIQQLTPPQQEMVLATLGIGLMKQSDGPNFRDAPKRVLFFAPQGMLDGNTILVSRRSGARSQQVMSAGELQLANPVTARIAPTVSFRIAGQQFQMETELGPLFVPDNVAIDANVTASSTEGGYKAEAAIDGVAGGYPNDSSAEWSSNGEKVGATLRLDWDKPQMVDRIVLFDRPNSTDDVTSGVLTFSDGSTMDVGALSNQGTEVRFPAKTISWVSFKVTGVKEGTINAGLSEIAVFKAH